MSKDKHSFHQDQAQQIISSLAQKELELQKKTDEAKAEVSKVIEQAKAKAFSTLQQTRFQIQEKTAVRKKEIAEKAASLTDKKTTQAREQSAQLEQQAQANRGKAIELIIQQVFPES